MLKAKPDRQALTLSEFSRNASHLLAEVCRSKKFLWLSQEGRGAAVVVDASEYDRLVEELELLRDIQIASQQIAKGLAVPHEEAKSRVLSRLSK
ncbi:MAG: type II toxin-antitoxin system prevent-host-death family antitoxin [Acidobacteriota bacterium]